MSIKTGEYRKSTRPNSTSRFPREEILQIVSEVEDGRSIKEACGKYGMAYCTVVGWMSKFGSPDYQSAKKPKFSARITPQNRTCGRFPNVSCLTVQFFPPLRRVPMKPLHAVFQFPSELRQIISNIHAHQARNRPVRPPRRVGTMERQRIVVGATRFFSARGVR